MRPNQIVQHLLTIRVAEYGGDRVREEGERENEEQPFCLRIRA